MNLYIHVPFCIKKCNYCAFYSICPDAIDWDEYARGIIEQLDYFEIGNYEIETLFFGGGTPSLMPVKYAEKIRRKLRLAPNCEWTIEANPKTLGSLELKDWKDLGLNRLSVGLQSFDDGELKFLGRIHTAKEGLDLLNRAFDLGLRTSGDFIYGLPNQNVEDVARLCGRINDIELKHASLYELTIEAGTKFENLPPPELSAEMYLAIQETLKLPRYEISNYGDPCRHNENVWAGEEYIGVGESAAGRIVKNGIWRETKIADGRIVETPLTNRDRATEIVMTGLRTQKGISLLNYPERSSNTKLPPCGGVGGAFLRAGGGYHKDYLQRILDWNFINSHPEYFIRSKESLSMTDPGLLILDSLLPKIII